MNCFGRYNDDYSRIYFKFFFCDMKNSSPLCAYNYFISFVLMRGCYFSKQLSSIMSTTPEVIAFSQQKMIIISSTYFICGINEVLCGTLRGMGKPIIPTVSTLIFMCALRFVWVYVIFPYCPNLTFLYLVWPIGWILSIITLLVFYYLNIAKLQKNT